MNHAEIKAAILKAVGNPSSGAIAANADAMAAAVVELYSPKSTKPEGSSAEARVVKAKETR